MKDETLLDRAASNFRYALKNYRSLSGDDVELNFIGHSLQQACELCIKHCMEMNGIRYPHTHSIKDLLDECELQKVPIVFSQEFYCFSPIISAWESEIQYIKNYVLSKKQVEIGFRLVKEFLLCNDLSNDALEMNCF